MDKSEELTDEELAAAAMRNHEEFLRTGKCYSQDEMKKTRERVLFRPRTL